MKKVLMIAPCSLKENTIGGIIAKNKTLYGYLKVRYAVTIVDTFWVKKNWLQYIYMKYVNKLLWITKILVVGKISDGIVLGSNEDNYLKILDKFRFINKTSLFAMGGIVPQRVSDSKIPIEVWGELKNIYVESEKMVSELQHMGLKNVLFLKNFKNLPKYIPKGKVEKKKILHIFYHGRICEDKGIDCIIRAIERVNSDFVRYVLHLYGEIDDNYQLKTNENIVYEGRIDLVGSLDDYDKLHKYDIFVFASKWRAEGISGSMLDALALGMPILASKHNLNGEFVSEGVNGHLFDKDDDSRLAELLIQLYENQNKIIEFGNNSLKLAEKYRVENVLNGINIL